MTVIDLTQDIAYRDCRWALDRKAAEPGNPLVQDLMDAMLAENEPKLDRDNYQDIQRRKQVA